MKQAKKMEMNRMNRMKIKYFNRPILECCAIFCSHFKEHFDHQGILESPIATTLGEPLKNKEHSRI